MSCMPLAMSSAFSNVRTVWIAVCEEDVVTNSILSLANVISKESWTESTFDTALRTARTAADKSFDPENRHN